MKRFEMFDAMDIRFLNTFIEVARTRHFGKAAENLYLTQSAVSARIKQLEEYFNTALFVRQRNSIKLTPAGEKLLPFAENLSHTLGEARRSLKDTEIQHIVISGTPNAWELYLQDELPGIQNQFADLTVRAEVINNESMVRLLHERLIDLAFSLEPIKSDEVVSDCILTSSLALYSSHQQDIEQALEQYIHIDWGVKSSESIEKQYPKTRQANFRTGSIQVALSYFAKNGGSLILPDKIADSFSGDMHRLEMVPIEIKTYIHYLSETNKRGMQEVIDYLSGE